MEETHQAESKNSETATPQKKSPKKIEPLVI